MLRFLKFMFFGLAVYGLYEFGRGLIGHVSDQAGESDLDDALNESSGRMQSLTGRGAGHDEQTLDSDGASIHHRVGRGVIAR